MCYASRVAESGGFDRKARSVGPRFGVLDSCRFRLDVLHITAEVKL